MSVLEALREALMQLRLQPLRTALTLFGLVWGTAAVIFLSSWGVGLQSMLEASFQRMGKNLVQIWPGRVSENFSPAVDRRWLWFTRGDVEALRRRARQSELVAGETRNYVAAAFHQRARNVELRGVELEGVAIRGVSVADGRLFTRADLSQRRRVAVLGEKARREVLGAEGRVGDWIRLDGRPFQVVGVLGRVGTQLTRDGNAIDDQVWVPITTHLAAWPNPWIDEPMVNSILLRMRDRKRMEEAKREARAILAERLGVPPLDEEAIPMFSPVEMLRTIPIEEQNITNFVIAATTILIGGVGVLSMMLDSVRERRAEIGLRLAVGALRSEVLGQLLFETGFLVALGGALGVALGVGLSRFLASPGFRSAIPPDLADLVPVPEIQGATVVAAVVLIAIAGVVSGFVPAWRAARIDPALTLRSVE